MCRGTRTPWRGAAGAARTAADGGRRGSACGRRPLLVAGFGAGGQVDGEARADAVAALDLDAATEQRQQLPGDRQAEAGATVFTRVRLVELAEVLEDRLQVLGPDADARVGTMMRTAPLAAAAGPLP
jgi:hypothetical protein